MRLAVRKVGENRPFDLFPIDFDLAHSPLDMIGIPELDLVRGAAELATNTI